MAAKSPVHTTKKLLIPEKNKSTLSNITVTIPSVVQRREPKFRLNPAA